MYCRGSRETVGGKGLGSVCKKEDIRKREHKEVSLSGRSRVPSGQPLLSAFSDLNAPE